MISRINTPKLIFLSLALGLGSCKKDNKLKKTENLTSESAANTEEKLPENDKDSGNYLYEYGSREPLDPDKNYYQVHGTDENGNKVTGAINIEGEIGIGIINGIEAKGIEIVAERTGPNLLIATDVKGYEYKLKVDNN